MTQPNSWPPPTPQQYQVRPASGFQPPAAPTAQSQPRPAWQPAFNAPAQWSQRPAANQPYQSTPQRLVPAQTWPPPGAAQPQAQAYRAAAPAAYTQPAGPAQPQYRAPQQPQAPQIWAQPQYRAPQPAAQPQAYAQPRPYAPPQPYQQAAPRSYTAPYQAPAQRAVTPYGTPYQPQRPGYPPAYQGYQGYPQQYRPYGPYGPYAPPKRKSRAPIVALFAVLLITPFAAGLVYSATHTDTPTGNPTTTSPTVSPTTYTPPPPQTDGPANAELSQYPEDLNPPELPRPTTEAERTAYLETNALYDQTLQEIDCPVEMIDWTTASAEAVDDLLTVIEGCIMRVWSPALEAAGWVLPRPGVTVYTTDITTACGTAMRRNAFYCSVDQQIYYSYDYPDIVDPNGRTLLINAVDLMAHEFGHHIQGRTGILRAERYRENTAETQEEANEYSRRTEVQADCFSGIFNRAIAASVGYTEADWASIRATLDIQGDNGPGGDHGQSATRIAWMERGASGLNVSQCNSYIAPSSEVT